MKKIIFALFFIMSFAVTFTGCSGEKKKPIQKGRDMIKITTKEPEETTQEDENLSYDVKDLAVVLSVDLEWDKVEGALNYKIYNVCKNDEFIVQTEDTQADIVLEANKDYTFGVMVEGKDYISNIIASKDVFYYIENPEILSVVQEDNKVYISTNISPFYENVSLYRKSSGDYSKVDAGKDSEGVFKDTIPGDGLCYSYKIVATDIYGNKKEVVSDTQVSYVGTVTINSVMYDTDSNTIRVSFDKAEEGAAGYIVYKSTNGSDFTPIKKIDNIEMTTFVDMDFDSNNTYSYKVAVYGGYEGALFQSHQMVSMWKA